MELNGEIKELFDKFDGGFYQYFSNDGKISFSADDSHGIKDIGFINLETDCTYGFFYDKDGDINICHTDNGRYIEGNLEFASDEIYKTVVNKILEAIEHIETNGFDIDKFDEVVMKEYEILKNDLKEFEEKDRKDEFYTSTLTKFNDMERIINEHAKLFWKD